MDSEIELKLLVAADAEKKIRKQFIPELSVDFEHESIQLCNIYYDTSEQLLRHNGMGLRVRGNNGDFEQTIKSKDGSVGGLHKRSEHNINLTSNNLDISLFPADIWPEHFSIEELNSQLATLFSTHFRREQYLLELSDGNLVEMVFDIGEIETEKYQAPVCEVELELKKGSPESLFVLARRLLDVVPFRLGYKSKAQRGYELVAGEDAEDGPVDLLFPVEKQAEIQRSFSVLIGKTIEYWQYAEQRYIEHKKPRDLILLDQIIRLAYQAVSLFEQKLQCPEVSKLLENFADQLNSWHWVEELAAIKELLSKKGFYRKKLVKNDAVMKQLQDRQRELLENHQPIQLLHNKSYILLQLEILELLTKRPWANDPQLASDAINKFAKKAIKEELKHTIKNFEFNSSDALSGYLAGLNSLEKMGQLHTLLGSVIGNRTVDSLETWIDLLDGAQELKTLNLLEAHLRKILLDGKDSLIQWCVAKQQSLVNVMELNRKSALSVNND